MIADPGVVHLTPVRSQIFVEIGREIFATIVLLLPLIQERMLSDTNKSMCTKNWLITYSKLAQEKCD